LQRLQKAANDLGIKETPLSFSVSPKDEKQFVEGGEFFFGESKRYFAH